MRMNSASRSPHHVSLFRRKQSVPETDYHDEKEKSGEIWENCDHGTKPGEGDDTHESTGRMVRVGKYGSVVR